MIAKHVLSPINLGISYLMPCTHSAALRTALLLYYNTITSTSEEIWGNPPHSVSGSVKPNFDMLLSYLRNYPIWCKRG